MNQTISLIDRLNALSEYERMLVITFLIGRSPLLVEEAFDEVRDIVEEGIDNTRLT